MRPFRFALGALLAAVALVPSPVRAQAQTGAVPLKPGTRVRVTAPTLVAPLVANFLQERGDTIVFIEDGAGHGVWSLAISQITRLEQSAGDRRSNRPYLVKGIMYGAPAGALAALAVVSLSTPDTGKEFSRVASVSVGAALGALAGAAVGSRYARERWTPVALQRRVSLAPARAGRGLTISLTF